MCKPLLLLIVFSIVWFPSGTRAQTTFTSATCRQTDVLAETKLHITPVPQAQQYRFKIQEIQSKKTQDILQDQSKPWIKLSQLNTGKVPFIWGGKYRIQVQTKRHNTWSKWSPWCTLRTKDDIDETDIPKPIAIQNTIIRCIHEISFNDSLSVVPPSTGTTMWYQDSSLINLLHIGNQFMPVTNSTKSYYVVTQIDNKQSESIVFEAIVDNMSIPEVLYMGSNAPVRENELLQLYTMVEGDNQQYQFNWYNTQGIWVGKGQELVLNTTSLSGNQFYTVSISSLNLEGCTRTQSIGVYISPPISLEEIPSYKPTDSLAVTSKLLLDDVYYEIRDGQLIFDYWEKYQASSLNCKLYDWKRQEIGKVNLQTRLGINHYDLDLSNGFCQNNAYYTVEFTDGKGVLEQFRFKYQSDEELSPSFYAAIPCAGNKYQGMLRLQGGQAPYQVEVFTAINDSLTYNYVYEENPQQVIETQLNNYELLSNSTKSGNTYYFKIKVTDNVGHVRRIERHFKPLVCEKPMFSTPTHQVPVLQLEFYHHESIVQPITPNSTNKDAKAY